MKIFILCPWKNKATEFSDAQNEYLKRLKTFQIEWIYLPSHNVSEKFGLKDFEAWKKKFAKNLPINKTVLLHERGTTATTLQLKSMMEELALLPGPLLFIFGPSYGLNEDLLNFIPRKLSLSALTFPHKLSTLILVEQIYRVETIMHNADYHHD
jgi:23S rRNA (pseudouridine1915-N3)-methyltransferase